MKQKIINYIIKFEKNKFKCVNYAILLAKLTDTLTKNLQLNRHSFIDFDVKKMKISDQIINGYFLNFL